MAMFESKWSALALGLAALTGCGFSSPVVTACGPTNSPNWISCMLEIAPYRAIDSDTRKVVYETPGRIRVVHGRSCVAAESARNTDSVGFRVRDKESVPFSFADSGTVFMNGWELHFKNGDHHLSGIGSTIANIRTQRSADGIELSWDAGGVLTDNNGDDPYEWCYAYTIVFWKRGASGFDAVLSSSDGAVLQDSPKDYGNDSALRFLPGSAPNPYGPGVVLPQGFAMVMADDDHHLLQIGLDYGQHSSTEAGKISWESRTLLKDNDRRRDYYAGELVSVLSYSSPQSWHPKAVLREAALGNWQSVPNEVPLTPRGSSSYCSAYGESTHEEHYKIENVPFDYAVPVLKGWELGYLCTDHHVRDIGASITDFRYERSSNGKGGTLFYTLNLKLADDSGNLNYGHASIDVLGMTPRGVGVSTLESK